MYWHLQMHNLLGGNILVRTTENSDGSRPKTAAASLWETMDNADKEHVSFALNLIASSASFLYLFTFASLFRCQPATGYRRTRSALQLKRS